MKLFDTHVHYWNPTSKKNPWLLTAPYSNGFLGDYGAICKPFLPHDLIKLIPELYQLCGTTHIEAGWDNNDIMGESQWIQSLANEQTTPICCISYADLTHPNLSDILAKNNEISVFKGIRQRINWHKNSDLFDAENNYAYNERFHQGLLTLDKHSLIFEIQAYTDQLKHILPTIAKCPHTTFIIEHCGLPIFEDKHSFNTWTQTLKKAAELEHVYLKLSGLDMCARNSSYMVNKAQIIDTCITHFGIDKTLFGSNFPVEHLYTTYAQVLEDILAHGLSENEKARVFHQNAQEVYKFNLGS